MINRLLPIAILLAMTAGCSGGCGEEPQGPTKPSSSAPAAAASHGAIGEANLARYDTAGRKTSAVTAKSQAGEVGREAAATLVADVNAQNFREKVLRPGATVFLTVVGANCEDCEVVLPVIGALAQEFSGHYEFYKFDGMSVGASGLLPPKVSATPLPAFVLYKKGKPASRLQGLPFGRETGKDGKYAESLEDYRKRLAFWLRDALSVGNLNFSRPARKVPAKKS